jgi:acetate---CoA ligase (ADP-forming) subunit beta
VVLLGIGGKGVEIYKDRTLRMAPVQERDVMFMVNCLTAGRLLSGFRGESPIDMQALIGLMTAFSKLLLKTADQITSIDLNPVICSPQGCVAADARILLKDVATIVAHPYTITADPQWGAMPQ